MLDLQDLHDAADAAMPSALRALEAAARHTVHAIVKRRTRYFRDDPLRLETIAHGLWCADPASLIATGRTMLENERRFPRPHFGFGGEVPAINAKALIVLGRYQRRMWAAIRSGE